MRETPLQAIQRKLNERIEILGAISSDDDGLTRIFLSREMDTAAKLIQSWMRNAGLVTSIDPLQNVVGSWPMEHAQAPSIHVGSHYDTVINAGKFDGPLGILLSIAAIEILQMEGYTPKHPLNILGFCDEEGVRFHTTFLGSSLLCGTFDMSNLDKRDANDTSMRDALRMRGFDADQIPNLKPHIKPDDIFLEAHIEQGPTLEALDLPLAVVTGIAAQTRIQVSVTGKSGHAGTTPPELRKDALTATAEMILAVEHLLASVPAARATVGQLKVLPNASNAIPGTTSFSIDLRHPETERMRILRVELLQTLHTIAERRGIKIQSQIVQEAEAADCDEKVKNIISEAISKHQARAPRLSSGAGHDTLKIAQTCRTGMMFIRCRDGLSHHPDEFVAPEDINAALYAWVDTIRDLDQNMPTR